MRKHQNHFLLLNSILINIFFSGFGKFHRISITSTVIRGNTLPVVFRISKVDTTSMVNVSIHNNLGCVLILGGTFLTINDSYIGMNTMNDYGIMTDSISVININNLTVINNVIANTLMKFTDMETSINICNLTAYGNNITAPVKFLDLSTKQNIDAITLKDIQIVSNVNKDAFGYIFRTELYSFAKNIEVNHVSASYRRNQLNKNSNLITIFQFIMNRDPQIIRLSSYSSISISIDCPKHYNPAPIKFHKTNSKFQFQLDCTSCGKGEYVLRGGKRILNQTSMKFKSRNNSERSEITAYDTKDECKACPTGGDCTYQIKSQDNSYGYIENRNEIKFIQCPNQYCCSDKGQKCTSYYTCNINRKGTLCGSCMDGYHINFFSNKCTSNSQCTSINQLAFWCIYLLSAIMIGNVIKSLKNIILFVKRKLMPVIQWIKTKVDAIKGKDKNSKVRITHFNLSDFIYSAGRSLHLSSVTFESDYHSQETQTCKGDIEEEVSFSAIFNILMSFYQLKLVMEVQLIFGFSTPMTFVSTFFNLNTNADTLLTICPLASMDVVFREFVKTYLTSATMLAATMLPIPMFWILQRFSSCLSHRV